MDKSTHLTTDDLILFMDRELDKAATTSAEQHLLRCLECGNRLEALQSGSTAFDRYKEQVLKPDLQVPVNGWPRLSDRPTPKPRIAWRFWFAAAALAGILALVWLSFPIRKQPSAQDVLEKALAAPQPRGEILLTTGKYRFARPAVLEAGASETRFQHVKALFVQANYSWTDPLSARSFATWRKHLSEKRDVVTAVHGVGGRRFYRISTRTDSSTLHSASLTLEAVNYYPTHASFEFQGAEPIEISEEGRAPEDRPQKAEAPSRKVTETVAGPEDELRVFTALDAIGADTEEPVDVKLDAGHHNVLVTGMGVAPDRRKQIETALARLPNTIVRFSSSQPIRKEPGVAAIPDTASDNGSSQFRQKLQELAGGVRQLQTITDESTETSSALFAQSHSLLVLAQQFPPAVEASLSPTYANTLLALRQRHLGAMSYALHRLRDQLKPLLTENTLITEQRSGASWQSTADDLYEAARNLDRLVSRLLAETYDEQAGELMLKQLPDDLSKVETLVLADSR